MSKDAKTLIDEVMEVEVPGTRDFIDVLDFFSSDDEKLDLLLKAQIYQIRLEQGLSNESSSSGRQFNSIKNIPIEASAFNTYESPDPVTINVNERKPILDKSLEDYGVLLELGASDKKYSKYSYSIDGKGLTDEPQREPLGLFNNPYEFKFPILFEDYIRINIYRTEDASSSDDYTGKIRYLEVPEYIYNYLAGLWGI